MSVLQPHYVICINQSVLSLCVLLQTFIATSLCRSYVALILQVESADWQQRARDAVAKSTEAAVELRKVS